MASCTVVPAPPTTALQPHAGYEDRAHGFSLATAPLAAVTGFVVLLIGITLRCAALSVAALLLAVAFIVIYAMANNAETPKALFKVKAQAKNTGDTLLLKAVHQVAYDRGYLNLLVTFARSNMQGRLLLHDDIVLLRKLVIMETINDQLKNISQIEHSRHRSPLNFVVNLFAGLIAYCLQPKKPSLHLHGHAWLSAA